jgi:hypothetical protein
MTPFRARFNSQVFAAIFTATFAGTGCNFILNPERYDDVIRCKNTSECEGESYFFDALNTERVDASCAAPGSGGGGFTSSKTNQVCSVVDKASVSCDPAVFMKGPFYDAWERANTNKAAYVPCSGDKLGTFGCAPTFNGTCANGLEVNDYGVCDDGSGLPLFPASDELFGQDVKDQHCRSYFCDDAFVCNGRTNKCIRCDPSKDTVGDLGQGACGDLALQGVRSTVYQSKGDLESMCPDASDVEMTVFGPPVVVAPAP